MKNSCFWSAVALVAIALCLEVVKVSTEASYKVNESGGRQVDGNYCGDQITDLYDDICSSGKRKRRSALMDEKEALSFLQSRSPRIARNAADSSSTDIVEECCDEGCAYEEVMEYC